MVCILRNKKWWTAVHPLFYSAVTDLQGYAVYPRLSLCLQRYAINCVTTMQIGAQVDWHRWNDDIDPFLFNTFLAIVVTAPRLTSWIFPSVARTTGSLIMRLLEYFSIRGDCSVFNFPYGKAFSLR